MRAGLLLTALVAMSASAFADTIHHVRFAQPAQILVWQDGALLGQGQTVNVLGPSIFTTGDLLGSGQVQPVLSGGSDQPSLMRLTIASNAAFVVETRDPLVAAQVQARIVQVGANAKAVTRVLDSASAIVFAQAEKTAFRPGAPKTQAIEIELSWTGAAPSDLRIIATAP